MRELRELKRKILYKGKPTEIVMREMLLSQRDAFASQATRATEQGGVKVDEALYWELLITRSILSPPELSTPAAFRELTAKEGALLKTMWLDLNEAQVSDFLEDKPKVAENTSDPSSPSEKPAG